MRAVEIDRRDAGGIGGKIGQDIAAAGGDGDDVVPGLDLERLQVDDRILPDLRIDELRKRQGEHPLQHPRPRQWPRAVHSRFQGRAGRLPDRLGGVRQVESPSSGLDGSALDESHDGRVTASTLRFRRAFVMPRGRRSSARLFSPVFFQEGSPKRAKKERIGWEGARRSASLTRYLRSVLALGGWGARKPSKPRTDLAWHQSNMPACYGRRLSRSWPN